MDKKALLDELKIDRERSKRARWPWIVFVPIAVIGGLGIVAWAFGVPFVASDLTEVDTYVVRASVDPGSDGVVLDASGYVVARRQTTVSSKTTGKVEEVLIEEGMTVEAGQLLAVLDDSLPRAQLELEESRLAAAETALDEIKASIQQAELDLERTADLAERELASRADLDRDRIALKGLTARLAYAERQLEVANKAVDVQRLLLGDMEIRAPFGGVVIAKAAQPGEMISPISAGGGFTRTGICTIVDMESLEIEVDVNEAFINRVRPGQPVTARLNAYPDARIPAEVVATIPAADRSKATVRVRIGFKDRDSRIVPDMGVKVAFLEEATDVVEAPPPGVLVPRSAVVSDGGGRYVFVVRADRTENGTVPVERRAVLVGSEQDSLLRIVDGLRAGERIVSDPPLGLGDGWRVVLAD